MTQLKKTSEQIESELSALEADCPAPMVFKTREELDLLPRDRLDEYIEEFDKHSAEVDAYWDRVCRLRNA